MNHKIIEEKIRKQFSLDFHEKNTPHRWDSLLALKIILFCEKEFQAAFIPADLLPQNFSSVENIALLVKKRISNEAKII